MVGLTFELLFSARRKDEPLLNLMLFREELGPEDYILF